MIDYGRLDASSVMDYVFYPREYKSPTPVNGFDLSVDVGDGVTVMCRFYVGFQGGPWILYFHGNGEVVGDYDELSSFYTRRKMNLVVADYRGYGTSTGTPTLTDVVRDSHTIFKAVKNELERRGYGKGLWVMGRSLGSMSALELASVHGDEIRGIIIESGFVSVVSIIRHLDVPVPSGADLEGLYGQAVEMAARIKTPALIIHGEYDNLVPYREAEALCDAIGSEKKELLMISAADHNDIMFVGLGEYFAAIERFIEETAPTE